MPASTPPEPRRSRADLLTHVQRRGRTIRRRRRVVTAVSGLAAAALLVGVVAQLNFDKTNVRVTAASDPGTPVQPEAITTPAEPASTTTSPPNSPPATSSSTTTTAHNGAAVAKPTQATPLSTTTSSAPIQTTSTTSAAVETTTTTLAPVTTTTALNCYQSYDSRCGEFRWDPAPTVDPMTVSLTVLTASPKVGQPITFKIVADEQDTNISPCAFGSFGDAPENPCAGGTYGNCPPSPQATGAWPPPRKQPDHYETTMTHTYQKAGTYTATFGMATGFPGCHSPEDKDPYRNHATGKVTVTVQP
jgi:hypothetical protein